jgi:hypothetical protein
VFKSGGDGSSAPGPYRNRESKRPAIVDKICENSADVAAEYIAVGLEGTGASSNAWQIGVSVVGHRVLGPVRRFVEIAGIAIGVLSGHLVMAAVCFKAWVHDESRRLLVSVIKSVILGNRSRPAGRRPSSDRPNLRTPGRSDRAIPSGRPVRRNLDDSRTAPGRDLPAHGGGRSPGSGVPSRTPATQRNAPPTRGWQVSVPPPTSPALCSGPADYDRRSGSVPSRTPPATAARGRPGSARPRRSTVASAPGFAIRASRSGRD